MRFKITAIIGLVAVALAGCVRPAKMDELAMTIRAIGPTGETWYKPHPQPIWIFSITNTGTREVWWKSGIERKGGHDREYSIAGGFVDSPEGVLGPGEGLHTEMIVPASTGSVWRAVVDYYPTGKGARVKHTTVDEWH